MSQFSLSGVGWLSELLGSWMVTRSSLPTVLRNMTFSSQVFSKLNVPRFQRNLPASCQLYLPSAAERDHVLATRRRMPIINSTGRCPMNLGACDLQDFGDLVEAVSVELYFDVLGVRLTIRARVEPGHDHRLVWSEPRPYQGPFAATLREPSSPPKPTAISNRVVDLMEAPPITVFS